MRRNLLVLAAAALVVALPFIFRQRGETAQWQTGDPVLVVISPHNEAIRYEFARAFSDWHLRYHGKPVKIDWRNIGGTTEIMRYLAAEYMASLRAGWISLGNPWPPGAAGAVLDRRFDLNAPPAGATPAARTQWKQTCDIYRAFRETDDARMFTSRIDLFFGGGAYDHDKAAGQGFSVPPWPLDTPPPGILTAAGAAEGQTLVPAEMSGEPWHTAHFYGNVLSTFGICYNPDRLRELGIARAPVKWMDLADPAYIGQLGVADPTKSGSIAKAFEMIVHEQCRRAVDDAGFTADKVDEFEQKIRVGNRPDGTLPEGVPLAYPHAVEEGWLAGIRLVQRICANARYFTDSASQVPIDVSTGNAAAGLAIDFYGRFQAETSRGPNGETRLIYVTPVGGSSVSADPISLLRGAEHRELAVLFMRFVLSEDGQKLWNYAPGTPGGPHKFALRRMPIRRDFYPSSDPNVPSRYEEHRIHYVDPLGDPAVNPYSLAAQFIYRPRWTARHFSIHRDLIRAMCMDSGEELRAAWAAIVANGGPAAQPEAMALLARMPDSPEPLTWASAPGVHTRGSRIDTMRAWTIFFRNSYREARETAEKKRHGAGE